MNETEHSFKPTSFTTDKNDNGMLLEQPTALLKSSSDLSNNHTNNNKHYANVKMKYFQSLGMQQAPNLTAIAPKREKNRSVSSTSTINNQLLEEPAEQLRADSPSKKGRSISSPPLPQQNRISPPTAIPVPKRKNSNMDSDSDDEDSEKFRPPHEMMQSQSFKVGTAYDVAVWDRQRRRNNKN